MTLTRLSARRAKAVDESFLSAPIIVPMRHITIRADNPSRTVESEDNHPLDERARPIYALTCIRFFAALAVVLYHYSYVIRYPSALNRVLAHGPNAVGLFFILSGFILYYMYHQRFHNGVAGPQYWHFARARFARIYPMYFIALLLATPLVLFSTHSPRGAQFSGARLAS